MKRFTYTVILMVWAFLNVNAQNQFSIYFKSGQYEVSASQKQRLEQWIAANKTSKILAINGYTDDDGAVGYNDTLSMKRVQSVYKLVHNQVNIRSDFKTLHFGKLHKQSPNKAENRRATLYYLTVDELDKEDVLIPKTPKKTPITDSKKTDYPDAISIKNPNGTESILYLNKVWMDELADTEVGQLLEMEELNFVLNTFAVTADSRSSLYALFMVMLHHPQLQIAIEGHICCISNDRTNLSLDRAKAVKTFLVRQGIDSKRISVKGFGSTQPKFAIPEESEDERAANRRVAIRVLSK